MLCYKVLFYYYVNWVYLVAWEQWHNENSFTFVHICQPFDIYYVLIRKGHWFRFHVSCSSLIITFSSSSTRLLAILADFLSSFTNFTTFRAIHINSYKNGKINLSDVIINRDKNNLIIRYRSGEVQSHSILIEFINLI